MYAKRLVAGWGFCVDLILAFSAHVALPILPLAFVFVTVAILTDSCAVLLVIAPLARKFVTIAAFEYALALTHAGTPVARVCVSIIVPSFTVSMHLTVTKLARVTLHSIGRASSARQLAFAILAIVAELTLIDITVCVEDTPLPCA